MVDWAGLRRKAEIQRMDHGLRQAQLQEQMGSVNAIRDGWANMHDMDKAALALSMVPVAGDVAGLAADARMYAQEPEQRTWGNYGLSALGLLPFVPGVAGITKAANSLPMDEASRMQRARDMGHTMDVYTGSTHPNITAFDGNLASPEGDWGRATYASTSIDDVNANYAGVGPDLTGRVGTEAERVADELMDWPEGLLDDYDIPLSRYEADEVGVAEEIARHRLVGGAPDGVVYPLKAKTESYAVIGGTESSKLYEKDYYDAARSDLDPQDFDDLDEFEDAVSERAWELQADDPESLYGRVSEALNGTDIYQDDHTKAAIMEEIQDYMADGELDIDYLDDAIRSNVTDAYDDATGDLLSAGEISKQTLQNLGFEGVIDNKVDLKFGGGRQFGTGMDGVYPDTQHIITFPGKENNLRSIFATFDPSKANSANILATGLLGSIGLKTLMGEEETY